MFVVPFDAIKPPVLFLVGETHASVVALAGPLRYIEGLDPVDAQSRDGATFIRDEPAVVAAIAAAHVKDEESRSTIAAKPPTARGWELNIVDTHRHATHYPDNFEKQDVATLAWVDRFSDASSLAGVMRQPKNVVLRKPVFIAYA